MPSNSHPPSNPTTVAASARVEGVGLFTARRVSVLLMPAPAGSGIAFRRVDLASPERDRVIPASVGHVIPESRRTVLAADPESFRATVSVGGPAAAAGLASVQTVEHLLSALMGLGVRAVMIEVDGPELPIGDGSAGFWAEAIVAAGIAAASATGSVGADNRPIVVDEPIRIAESGAVIEALPLTANERAAALGGNGAGSFYAYHFDFANFPLAGLREAANRRVPPQSATISLPLAADERSRGEYRQEVAPARTFSLVEEAQAAQAAGLFKHVSPKDLLVIGDAGPIDNAWRFDTEAARHKLLDLIGDLGLVGRPFLGRIVATRSGHAMNHAMAQRLAELG